MYELRFIDFTQLWNNPTNDSYNIYYILYYILYTIYYTLYIILYIIYFILYIILYICILYYTLYFILYIIYYIISQPAGYNIITYLRLIPDSEQLKHHRNLSDSQIKWANLYFN